MEETHVAARRNGAGGGIFDIGNLVPSQRTIKIGDRELLGWKRGPGCKRSVAAAYEAARVRNNRADQEFASIGGNPGLYEAVLALVPSMQLITNLALQDSESAYSQFLELAPLMQGALNAPSVSDPVAWSEFLNEALTTVVPGLSLEEAELIDDPTAFAVLRHLGWFASVNGEDGAAADPPVTTAQSETSGT
jgi:hypothetical protein